MTTVSTSTSPADPFTYGGRGGKQRMIPHPLTGQPVGYQRVSTFAKTLDAGAGLAAWKTWMALRGSQQRPDLLQAALHAERTPGGVVEELVEAGGGKDAARRGTDRHQIVAMALTGAPLPDMPPDARAQLDATLDVIASLGQVTAVEAATVNDEYLTAGSCDLVLSAPNGQTIVAELKTGRVDRMSASIQLIAHARAQYWDGAQRTGWVAQGRPRLVVITAPQDGSQPTALDLDVEQAVVWAQLAVSVRQARKEASKKGN